MSEYKSMTIWERLDKNTGEWEYNHLEDGYDPTHAQPAPLSPEQKKSWGGSTWRAIEAVMFLDTYSVERVTHDPNVVPL